METEAIIGGVISGILATAIWYFSKKIISYYKNYKIKLLLGLRSNHKKNLFYLVYGEFVLRPRVFKIKSFWRSDGNFMAYCKSNRPNLPISIKSTISKCEVVAINYIISNLISKFGGKTKLVSDFESIDEYESNIISVGGIDSNNKTKLILEEANKRFGDINSRLDFHCGDYGNFGYILKYTPKKIIKKSWIIIAGSGESGTTGSAWFLANKYKEIFNRLYDPSEVFKFQESKDFLAFINVRDCIDENSEIVEFIEK
jgi:hypothetical protein